MANLLVRNVDDAIVEALKAQAREHGVSAEAEHRRILSEGVRTRPSRKSFAAVLSEIPSVGKDTEFERRQDEGADRKVFD